MSGTTPPTRSNSYEAKVAKIEAIIQQIQSGNLEIEEVFTQFELAMQDLHQCEAFLAQRQQQMDILIENLGEESSL